MFCKAAGRRAPESPHHVFRMGPCILYGELKQELKVVVGTADLAQPYCRKPKILAFSGEKK